MASAHGRLGGLLILFALSAAFREGTAGEKQAPPAGDFGKAALTWTLPWDADWVTAVTFVGPTRRVAAGNNLGQILLYDLPEKAGGPAPQPVRRLDGHTNAISRLLSTPDGRWLISASYDHTIRFWDMQAPASDKDAVVLNARAIADAKKRKGGKKPPPPQTVKVEVQKESRALSGHEDWVVGMALSADARLLLSGDDAGNTILWDREAGKELRRWKLKGWAYAVALAPDSKQALVSERVPLVFDSGRYAAVKTWDLQTGKPRHDLGPLFKGMHIAAAAYSPDGKMLALGRGGEVDGPGGKVSLVDAVTGKKLRELTPGHQYGVTDLAFHPDGKHLASTGRDTVVKIWNTADGKLVRQLGKPRGGQFKDWLHAVSFHAEGRWLVAADMAGAVAVWSLPK
jgi:WD40 repeat protein